MKTKSALIFKALLTGMVHLASFPIAGIAAVSSGNVGAGAHRLRALPFKV